MYVHELCIHILLHIFELLHGMAPCLYWIQVTFSSEEVAQK